MYEEQKIILIITQILNTGTPPSNKWRTLSNQTITCRKKYKNAHKSAKDFISLEKELLSLFKSAITQNILTENDIPDAHQLITTIRKTQHHIFCVNDTNGNRLNEIQTNIKQQIQKPI